jgi:site-specific DNA-methyltransferase (adenine-specific)
MIVHVLRKPLTGTVASNALAHGAGALNIDQCRIGSESRTNLAAGNKGGSASYNMGVYGMPAGVDARECTGRWPANLVHDGTDEVVGLFPQTTSVASVRGGVNDNKVYGKFAEAIRYECGYDDSGSAARFFQQVVLPR